MMDRILNNKWSIRIVALLLAAILFTSVNANNNNATTFQRLLLVIQKSSRMSRSKYIMIKRIYIFRVFQKPLQSRFQALVASFSLPKLNKTLPFMQI